MKRVDSMSELAPERREDVLERFDFEHPVFEQGHGYDVHGKVEAEDPGLRQLQVETSRELGVVDALAVLEGRERPTYVARKYIVERRERGESDEVIRHELTLVRNALQDRRVSEMGDSLNP